MYDRNIGMSKMNKMIKKNYARIKTVWLVMVFLCHYTAMFPYIFDTNFFLTKYFPLTGIAIFAMQIFYEKEWHKKGYLWIGGLMCFSYLITILVNFQYNLLPNTKNLFWLFLYFFLYYSYDVGQNREEYKKGIFLINNIIIVINIVCSMLSLLLFVIGMEIIDWNTYITYGYRYSDGRLYGVTSSVIGATVVAVISLALSMVNCKLYDCSKKWKRIYIGNAVITVILLVATATRGAPLTFGLFIFIFMFGKSFARDGNSWVKRFLRAFCKAFIMMACWVSLLVALRPIIGWFPYAATFYENGALVKHIEDGRESIERQEIDDEIGTLRPLSDAASPAGLFNRRTNWWTVFRNNWLFGIGAANEETYMKKYLGEIDARRSVQMHTFTNVMVFSGVCGFAGYLAFIICVSIYSVKNILEEGWNDSKEIGLVYLGLLLSMPLYAGVMYSNSYMSILYFLFAGCAIRFIEDGKECGLRK